MKQIFPILLIIGSLSVHSQKQKDTDWQQKFEQLGTLLPSPNSYRTASGAPGENYWQQQADYEIKVVLDDETQILTGSETITYHNNSPHALEYLWLQLDQNIRAKDSDTPLAVESEMQTNMSVFNVMSLTGTPEFDGGFKISSVQSGGKDLNYTINKTMMRVDPGEPISSNSKFELSIEWSYQINSVFLGGARSGFEYFEEDDNRSYAIAQFFPRMASYNDAEGWQNKQFLGDGEFALTFGNYEVEITVPRDFVVAATGTLQNEQEVLTSTQVSRLEKAKTSFDEPVVIITQEEAEANERKRSKGTKTWRFEADDVRDYAFIASRKYIWDAMAVKLGSNKTPVAMSLYPKEGNPLWEQWSTKTVASALETYSKYAFDYPYPVAIAAHVAGQGMEYPMICFNRGRPQPDGTVPEQTKYDMIGVIVHEIGHNYFPMIINTDERQWTWMDEGLNTFVQYLAEQEFMPGFPTDRGPAHLIVDYMSGQRGLVRPIMTNSEQILQFGNNAYAKPAASLDVLRRSVMGPELFDQAFKVFCERWAFKHPTPADFFRTMEDASAVDLDWFWRGWYYGTDYVDVSVDKVTWYRMQTEDSDLESKSIQGGNQSLQGGNSEELAINSEPKHFKFQEWTGSMGDYRQSFDQKSIKQNAAKKNYYEITFSNRGGLVTPIIIEWTYADGSKEIEKVPAEIWRYDEKKVTKVFLKDKEVVKVLVDPNRTTADVNTKDNVYPRSIQKDRFEQFKDRN